MFTGIIESKGEVVENQIDGVGRRLIITTAEKNLSVGESIAINGVCLTLLPGFSDKIVFNVSPETLKVTNLEHLSPGQSVNVERAMLGTTRFGGHYVTGHIDTTVRLLKKETLGDFIEFTIGEFQAPELAYLLPKGSIALEGVSLTINAIEKQCIKLLLVPHTLEKTTLGLKEEGDPLNVEFDYLTKIISHQLNMFTKANSILA